MKTPPMDEVIERVNTPTEQEVNTFDEWMEYSRKGAVVGVFVLSLKHGRMLTT